MRAADSRYGRGLNTAHHPTVFSSTSSRVSICGGKRRSELWKCRRCIQGAMRLIAIRR
jgi:hypothetical protein